jgi:hypothetical protein
MARTAGLSPGASTGTVERIRGLTYGMLGVKKEWLALLLLVLLLVVVGAGGVVLRRAAKFSRCFAVDCTPTDNNKEFVISALTPGTHTPSLPPSLNPTRLIFPSMRVSKQTN